MFSIKDFIDPPAENRLVPFWFWNESSPERFNARTISRQIRMMHDSGIGGFVIFNKPPFGFSEKDFLTSRWFEACEAALKAARRYGMRVWINDDFDFPPGGMAGRMKTLVPQAYHRELRCERFEVCGRNEFLFENTGEELVSAMGIKNGVCCFDEKINLLDDAKTSSDKLILKIPDGNWRIFIITSHAVKTPEGHLHRFPTFLDPEVNAVFIDTVYEQYKKRLGRYFGDPLTGFFADCDARRKTQFPWARRFDERFIETVGYSIRPYLPLLWENFGEISTKVRNDYFGFLSNLYSQWFENCYRWCCKNNLEYTYHTSDTGPFPRSVTSHTRCERSSYFCEGRFHEVNRYASYPGTDHELLALNGGLHFVPVFQNHHEDGKPKTIIWGNSAIHENYERVTLQNKTFGDVRAKMASSIAHLYQRKGAMCEAFAATNWGVTLDDLRWIANWQVSQGITMFVPHAFFFSLQGRRKQFAPPDHFRYSHLWENYRIFANYIGRLSYMLSGANHVADIAVLDPAESLWAENKTYNENSDVFFYLLDSLNHSPYDYDVVDEQSLLSAKISEQMLKIAKENYKVLIIPAVTVIHEETAKKIRRFVNNGGITIAIASLPQKLTELDIPILKKEKYDNRKIPVVTNITKYLSNVLKPDVLFSKNGKDIKYIHYIHVRKKRENVYFITNLEGDKSLDNLRVSFLCGGTPELWDPVTGKITPVDFARIHDRTDIQIQLHPRQGVLVVFVDKNRKPIVRLPKNRSPLKKLNNLKWNVQPLEPNILPLAVWKNGRKITSWGKSDAKKLMCEFEVGDELKDIRLLMPKEIRTWRWSVNRTNLNIRADRAHMILDDEYINCDITGEMIKGKNKIKLEIGDIDVFKTLDYTLPYIIGRFKVNVETSDKSKLIPYKQWYHFESYIAADTKIILRRQEDKLRFGNLSSQGYPFYSGKVKYSYCLVIGRQNLQQPLILDLGNLQGQIDVKINKEHVAILPWSPYQLNVTKFLKVGENNIEILTTNALANLLEEYPAI